MDTASTFMGLGLLFVFIAPIGYLLVDQSQQEKKRKKAILQTAAKQHLHLSACDFLPDLSLGLDEQAQKLLVVLGKKQKTEIFDLKDLSRCELGKKYQDNKVSSAIDDVREVHLHLDRKKDSENIIFYSEDAHPVTEKEMRMQMANKWQNLLSEKLG
ncbi:MAG: hypothetical protein WBL21_12645 [Salinimicrobium sp.]